MPPTSIRFHYFPLSNPCPPHLRGVVTAFKAAEPQLAEAYARWAPGGGERLPSNSVLAWVADALVAEGFKVERTGASVAGIDVPVLWSENNVVAKSFSADALWTDEAGRQTVVEVEAGGAVANNAWRKDLMEACLMPFVDYLVIAVRNEYRSTASRTRTARVGKDYATVSREVAAIYASEHWKLPLRGLMILGY